MATDRSSNESSRIRPEGRRATVSPRTSHVEDGEVRGFCVHVAEITAPQRLGPRQDTAGSCPVVCLVPQDSGRPRLLDQHRAV